MSKIKILFLSDYFVEDGIMGGAERSDSTIIEDLRDVADVVKVHTSDVVELRRVLGSPTFERDYHSILISNRTRLGRDSKDLIQGVSVPYHIIERDCQFVKSRNVATYRNYIAPPSQVNDARFYNSAETVFALCESHYSKIILNLPKAHVVNLGATHLASGERSLFESLRLAEKKSSNRIGIPKLKDWGSAARYAKLMRPDAIIEFFDTHPNRERFLQDVASYETIAFKPFVYESFSRICLESRMLGCSVITECPDDIGFFDSAFWVDWSERGADVGEAFGRVEASLETIRRALNLV